MCSSMADLTLHSGIDICGLTSPEEIGFHVLDQELLMVRIDGAQAVMIDELGLSGDPGFPAGLTYLFKYLFSELTSEGR